MEKIKVAIRTRPLIEREDGRSNWRIQNSNSIFQVNHLGKSIPNTAYSFDYIFDPLAPTLLLYEELVGPIVESVVAGFNGTVFAYGQTSSGKTFTMMGTDELPGLIPFTFAGLFDQISRSANCEFVLRLSYMEIYNESICDLLNPTNTNLNIREGDDRIPYVANLTEAHITDFYSLNEYMVKGERNRHTGSTRMNDRSSRSHTLFRLILESKQCDEGAIKVSHLNLVDLAGSERASATSGDEIRFKEGTFINRSLLTLGTVIRRLSEGKQGSHIPYRDSKLTRILESSLGGNAKTVIICTVTTASVEETHSTLRFASRAKSVENHAIVNEYSDDSDVDTMLKRLKKLEKENSHLKKKISEDASYKTQIQDMECKINSLKSLVISTSSSSASAVDQAPPTRRYTMGAFPSKSTSKFTANILEANDSQCSPNLLLAKKMITRPKNLKRRALQLDYTLEETDSVIENVTEKSVIENNKVKSNSGEFSSPNFNSTLDYRTIDSTTPIRYKQKIQTNTISLQTDAIPSPSVSASTQTDTSAVEPLLPISEIVKDNSDGGEKINNHREPSHFSNSVYIQTDCYEIYHCEKNLSIALQDSSFQTEILSNVEDSRNISISVQTEQAYLSEEEIAPANSSINYECNDGEMINSLTYLDISMQTDLCPDTTRVPSVDTYVQTGDKVDDIETHDISIQVEAGVLDTPPSVLKTEAFIDTENLHDAIHPISPTNFQNSSFQTKNVLTIDAYCSPFAIPNTNNSVNRECYLEVGTETDRLEMLGIEVQTDSIEHIPARSVVLNSLHTSTQTDNHDHTTDISVNTSVLEEYVPTSVSFSTIETQTDTIYQGLETGVQTDVELESNSSEFVYIQMLESEKKELFRNESVNQIDFVYVQTSFEEQHDKQEMQAEVTPSALPVCELTSTQSQTEMEISDILLGLNSTPIQTDDSELDFIMNEKLCEYEVNIEQLTRSVAAKEKEMEEFNDKKQTIAKQQNIMKDVLELLLNGLYSECEEEKEKCFLSLNQLIEDSESREMVALLKSLFSKMSSPKDTTPHQTVGTPITTDSTDIEVIRSMVSRWSEKELEQLPHYLHSVQTEIQNLNDIVKSKDSLISELTSEIDNVKIELRESTPTPANLQSVASQTQLPSESTQIDEVELAELIHLKNVNTQLEVQLSQSEVKSKEYAALLVDLQDDSTKPETKDASVATEQINMLSLDEVTNFESQLRINNEMMKYILEVREGIAGSFPTQMLATYVGYSDLGYYLDEVSQLLKIYTSDLDLLKDNHTKIDQLREEYCSCQETNSKNINEMKNKLEAEKVAHQKAQSNLNSAMDQITDLFNANDNADHQIKQMQVEAEKQMRYFENEKCSFEEKLNEANDVYEENEQLRTELESIQNLHSGSVDRKKVEEIANQVVKLERDNSFLQKENANLTATRSHQEGTILVLKTKIEANTFDFRQEMINFKQDLENERENSQQLSSQNSNSMSMMKELKGKIESQEVIIREREEETANIKDKLEDKARDFNALLGEYRGRKAVISILKDTEIPELKEELTAVTNERDSLKESLAAKYRDNAVPSSPIEDVDILSNSVDKLSMAQLKAKYEKQIGNLRRKIDFLEEQCRNSERRRQLEVSVMPKHDFLSLRADMASLKSQARTNNEKIFPKQDTQLYPGIEEPLDPMKNEPKTDENSTHNCNTQ